MDGEAAIEARKRKVETTLTDITNVHNSKKQKAGTSSKPEVEGTSNSVSLASEDGTFKVPHKDESDDPTEEDEHESIGDSDDDESSLDDEDDFDDIENLQKYILSDDVEEDETCSYYGDFDDFDDAEEEEDNYEAKEYEVEEFQYAIPGNPGTRVTIKAFLTKDAEYQPFKHWMQALYVTCTYEGKIIAHAHGKHIDRRQIRRNFWQDMEEPSQDTSRLGFHLFDRYGFLKSVWKDHDIRKGTGVWGKELDYGQFLLIETIDVDVKMRKQGIGKVLISTLIKKAEKLEGGLAFSLAITGCLNRVVDEETKGLTLSEATSIRGQHCDTANHFFRSVGFRRIGASRCFGLATDPNHAAHNITLADDYDPPEQDEIHVLNFEEDPNESSFSRDERYAEMLKQTKEQQFPMHSKIIILDDVECVAYLQSQKDSGFEDWHTLDYRHDNLLHVVARDIKPLSLRWLLKNVDQDGTLRNGRNIKGYTPVEALQAAVENIRTKRDHGMMTVCVMDEFEGYSPGTVACLALLKDLKKPTETQFLQMTYGCTCGACIGGLLPPRQRFILLTEAETIFDMTSMDTEDAEMWLISNESQIEHVAPDIQQNFRTNRSLRQGFANVFCHIATCLRQNQLPTTSNVVTAFQDASEWPPVTRNFFQRGGTVVSALRYVFESAMEQDKKVGDESFHDVPEFEAEHRRLPECRNDYEYGFVALACGVPGVGTDY